MNEKNNNEKSAVSFAHVLGLTHFERGRAVPRFLAEDSLSGNYIPFSCLLPVLIKCIDGTMEPACRFMKSHDFSDSVVIENVQVYVASCALASREAHSNSNSGSDSATK